MPVVGTAVADTADEAVAIAELYGYPVAVKWAAAHGEHKADVGAVHLNLTTPAGVRHAFEDISAAARPTDAAAPRVLVQPMVSSGVEMLVGVTSDPVFGPLVGVGLGGAQAEIFADVRFRAAPLTDQDADAMVNGTRAARLLGGFRGKPPADMAALRDLVLRVSMLADALPDVRELDLNPVMVLPKGAGCQIVDARVRLGSETPAGG